jgi:N-carbamoyl-L-amino-acid hydrolase
MASGAGHDAMTFASRGIPTGMIFIPCIEGKSHCPEEAIRWEDAGAGAQILADTILRIGYQRSSFLMGQKKLSGQ